MNQQPLAQVGRVAFRHEGDNWNAYYALPDTMEGAIPLGSIRMGAVVNNPARKQAFINLMRDIVSDIIKGETGIVPSWPSEPQPAPEHERSGNA